MPVDRSGRRKEWGEEDSKPFLRKVLARSWYIFIPLIGVWWFHMRELTPQVSAVNAQIAEDRHTVEMRRNDLLKGARTLGIQISRLRAFGDTLNVRSAQISSFLDSVRVIQQGNLEETRLLEAQADSLRRALSEAEGRSIDYSAALQQMQVQVDSLRALIAAHWEKTRELDEEIRAARDLTDRVAHPELYRKNSALVAGEGEFPNRDALPKR